MGTNLAASCRTIATDTNPGMKQHRPVIALALGTLCFTFGCSDDEAPAHAVAGTYGSPIPPEDGAEEGSDTPSTGDDSGVPANPSAPTSADGGAPDASDADASAGSPEDPPEQPAEPDPGPAPTQACTVQKDSDGFFTRKSSKSDYVAYVPASYDPTKPMRVIVGMHGCGDTALNFARWGMNPYATRSTQDHIGISVSGETGNNKCWSMGGDDDKVLAAVEDLATCFWVHRAKVVIAGFSSGGQLAYRVGMMHASSFAGILIENSGLYAAGSTPAALIAGASWKLPVAHRAHTGDTVFPIDKVRADWAAMKAAGFSVTTSEVAGGHDGTTDDWATWLIPQSKLWVRP
jgi:predicted esterase